MGFIGFALSYSMRFSISLAIVAMVKSSHIMKPSQNLHQVMFWKDICARNIVLHNYSHPHNFVQSDKDLHIIITPSPNDVTSTSSAFDSDNQETTSINYQNGRKMHNILFLKK